MAYRGIWIGWLSLVAVVLWAGVGTVAAQESTLQRRLAERVPIEELPEALREPVRQILQQPTLFGHGPTEAFAGDSAIYQWLLDHPDRGAVAWRRLGAKCSDITKRDNGVFAWTDGHGSEIRWQTIHKSATQRIWYAEGQVCPGLLLPPVPVHIVALLRHGQHQNETGRTLLYHQVYVFVQTDGKAATLITRILGRSAPNLAEQCVGQMEMFFSALVWYLDQHPDMSQNLFAASQAGSKK